MGDPLLKNYSQETGDIRQCSECKRDNHDILADENQSSRYICETPQVNNTGISREVLVKTSHRWHVIHSWDSYGAYYDNSNNIQQTVHSSQIKNVRIGSMTIKQILSTKIWNSGEVYDFLMRWSVDALMHMASPIRRLRVAWKLKLNKNHPFRLNFPLNTYPLKFQNFIKSRSNPVVIPDRNFKLLTNSSKPKIAMPGFKPITFVSSVENPKPRPKANVPPDPSTMPSSIVQDDIERTIVLAKLRELEDYYFFRLIYDAGMQKEAVAKHLATQLMLRGVLPTAIDISKYLTEAVEIPLIDSLLFSLTTVNLQKYSSILQYESLQGFLTDILVHLKDRVSQRTFVAFLRQHTLYQLPYEDRNDLRKRLNGDVERINHIALQMHEWRKMDFENRIDEFISRVSNLHPETEIQIKCGKPHFPRLGKSFSESHRNQISHQIAMYIFSDKQTNIPVPKETIHDSNNSKTNVRENNEQGAKAGSLASVAGAGTAAVKYILHYLTSEEDKPVVLQTKKRRYVV